MKKLAHYVREMAMNLSFRKKLIVVFGLIFMIPWIIFVSYTYRLIETQLTVQAQRTLTTTVSQVNENVYNVLQKYSDVSFSQYIDKNLISYLLLQDKKMDKYIDAYYLYFDPVFGQMPLLNQYISNVRVYTKNEYFPSDGLYVLPYKAVPFNDAFLSRIEAAAGNVAFGNISKDADNELIFTCARLLDYQQNTRSIGVIAVDIKCKEFYDLIAKELSNKELFVVTDDNVIVSCQNPEFGGAGLETVLDLGGRSITGSGSFDVDLDGSKSLVVYNTTRFGWKTIAVITYDSLLQDIRGQTTGLLIFSALVVVFAIACLYFVANIITKRIKKLAKGARQIERADFSINFGNMGSDEIGEFAKVFTSMAGQINTLIKDIYEKELVKKKAELNMLQSQINPHFMYNFFSSISSLALKSNDMRVYEMVNNLSKFYRISLNKGINIITVEEELELVRNYIAVQQVRFEGLIGVSYDVDQALLQNQTLKLIIQPLVENSINHGLWDDEKGIFISVRVFSEDEKMVYEVADNGRGIDEKTLEQLFDKNIRNKGYGIRNVDERIKIYYGPEFGLNIESEAGKGTKARVVVAKSI